MISKIFSLIFAKLFCLHQWDLYNEMKTYAYGRPAKDGHSPVETKHTLICKNCGKIKKITL